MKVDPQGILHDVYGAPMPRGQDGTPLTLGDVCITSLLSQHEGDRDEALDTKMRRHRLAQRLASGAAIDLAAEDVALLKHLVSRTYTVAVVGPAIDMLDPMGV